MQKAGALYILYREYWQEGKTLWNSSKSYEEKNGSSPIDMIDGETVSLCFFV